MDGSTPQMNTHTSKTFLAPKVQFSPNAVSFEPTEMPTLPQGGAIIQTLGCGLCGSDAEKITSIVNDDSTVYLTGVRAGSQYTVKIDKDNSCQFTINYDEKIEMKNINNTSLTCQ